MKFTKNLCLSLLLLATQGIMSMDAPSGYGQNYIIQAIKDGTYTTKYRTADKQQLQKIRTGLNNEDTLIMYAIDRGEPFDKRTVTENDRKSILLLLSQGLAINATGGLGDTALHRAIRMQDEETIHMLLRNGANTKIENKSNNTAEQIAKTYDIDLEKLLQEVHNGGSGSPKKRAVSPLLEVRGRFRADTGDLEKAIIEAVKNAEHKTLRPLLQLNKEQKQKILNKQIDVIKDEDIEGATSLLGSLIDHGYKKPTQKTTPAQREAMQVLLDNGAPVDKLASLGNTPLMQAARVGDQDAMVILLAGGADPSLINSDGETAQTIAKENNIPLDLLQQKAKKLTVIKSEILPLIKAIESQNTREVLQRASQTQNINMANAEGKTVLIYAIDAQDPTIIEALLDAGADPNMLYKGITATEYAQSKGIKLDNMLQHKSLPPSQRPLAPTAKTFKPEDAAQLLAVDSLTPSNRRRSNSKRSAIIMPKNVSLIRIIENFQEEDLTRLTEDDLMLLTQALAKEKKRRTMAASKPATLSPAAAAAYKPLEDSEIHKPLKNLSEKDLNDLNQKIEKALSKKNLD